MIKSYNQIRFDLLRLGNEIVGKNKVLYEPDYILEYLCIGEENNFALKENQEKVDRYISQLEEVNQKLQKIGKQLILYITPSKCDDTKRKYKILDVHNNLYSLLNLHLLLCYLHLRLHLTLWEELKEYKTQLQIIFFS